MNFPVIVTANQAGQVINQSENPDYGYIRVEQKRVKFNQNWARISKVSALIHGKIEDLQAMNLKDGDILPGKIVIIESISPFQDKNPEKDLKIAGDTGVICMYNDKPIYRSTLYTEDNDADDELIPHTNHDEILEAKEKLNSESL